MLQQKNVCGCGKGYASDFDNLCKFCREKTVRRDIAQGVGVRHKGDGLELDQLSKIKRKEDELTQRVLKSLKVEKCLNCETISNA